MSVMKSKELDVYLSPSPYHRSTSASRAAIAIASIVTATAIVVAIFYTEEIMRPFSVITTILFATFSPVTATVPFTFPLSNGFPFPNESALEELFTKAGGNFTNAPLAPKFDADSLTSWKLQAFNEFFEVAFFTQLIANISNGVTGYKLESGKEDYILNTLKAIQAQEQMHAYNANDAVRHFTNGSHIFPCAYVFPGVSNIQSAISMAQTFTDMYIGLLIEIQRRTAADLGTFSDSIVYVLAQALGQEGQQSGWFRSLLGKHPSAEPFLSPNTRDLHFSWLQRFIVPGSCPNMGEIPLQIYKPLELISKVVGTGPVRLRIPGKVDPESQRLAFINGALVPTIVPFNVTEAISATKSDDESVTEIVGHFPYSHNVMHGMTLATIVENRASFISALDVANATLYGPAVIEVS